MTKPSVGILALVSKYGGGMYQYTLSLMHTLKKYCNEYDFVLIRNTEFPNIFNENCEIYATSTTLPLKLKRLLYANIGIKLGDLLGEYKACLSHNIDLIISPLMSLIPYYMQKPYIVVIHDLQHKYFPNFFSFKERFKRDYVFKKTAIFAKLVVCESEYIKEDIVKFCRIFPDKIRIIQSPPTPYILDFTINEEKLNIIKRKYRLPDEFLFYPAQFWPHKNHINLIRAIYMLKHRYNIEIHLVLVGSKQNYFNKVMDEIEKLKIKNLVCYLGYVPENDMPYLYKLSTALIMPSLFESISMPIWEAFYLNIPVVSSNVCALPEQVGEAGLIFDPNNIANIAEKILKIWTDDDLRKVLITRGRERIKNLTPENYRIQWSKILKEVFNKNKT